MALATAVQTDLFGDARDTVPALVEDAWAQVCINKRSGLHVQEAEELWCQACGDFIAIDAAVIAPAL